MGYRYNVGIIPMKNCQRLPSNLFLSIQKTRIDLGSEMERINNASHRQIVINFYKKNQAKGKPYTIEYFRKLNITRHQVYHAIKRFESGISHKQQLGTGRHSHYGQRRTLRHFPLTND